MISNQCCKIISNHYNIHNLNNMVFELKSSQIVKSCIKKTNGFRFHNILLWLSTMRLYAKTASFNYSYDNFVHANLCKLCFELWYTQLAYQLIYRMNSLPKRRECRINQFPCFFFPVFLSLNVPSVAYNSCFHFLLHLLFTLLAIYKGKSTWAIFILCRVYHLLISD